MLSRLMTRREQMLLAFVATAFIVGALLLYLSRQPGEVQSARVTPEARSVDTSIPPGARAPKQAMLPPASAPDPIPVPLRKIPETAYVAAMGEVAKPGTYELSPGARIADLLDMAGGATLDADLEDINLAAPLIDGTTLTVPVREAAILEGNRLVLRGRPTFPAINPAPYTLSGHGTGVMPVASVTGRALPAVPQQGLINVNTATSEELQTLPGIGPVTAGAIIAYRDQTPFRSVDDLDSVKGVGPKKLETLRPLVSVE